MGTPLRVAVVDDSALMRQAVADILTRAGMEVVLRARSGQEALDQVPLLRPDVVTLDIEMPGLDGLTTLSRLMQIYPVPVVMISGLTTQGAEATVRALELGAVDFVAKPAPGQSFKDLAQALADQVLVAAGVKVGRVLSSQHETYQQPVLTGIKPGPIQVVAIGASTGGPSALHTVLSTFPRDFPAAVLLVQHMPPGFTASLAQRLNETCALPVREATQGEEIRPGMVLLAPAGWQMEVVRRGRAVQVHLGTEAPMPTLFKPSVDVLFTAVARVYTAWAVGVILTGMGNDGVRGLQRVKEQGGYTLGEAESSCVVYGMPRAAWEAGTVDCQLPLSQMSRGIIDLVIPKK